MKGIHRDALRLPRILVEDAEKGSLDYAEGMVSHSFEQGRSFDVAAAIRRSECLLESALVVP